MSIFKKDIKIGDYVMAIWEDSFTDPGDWHTEFTEEDIKSCMIETLGILTYQDKDRIIVSHMKGSNGKYKYSTLITSGMLKKLIKLKA